MAEITINGEPVEAEEGDLLFEVIRDQDIEVPHFCYHPELSLAGACRMCLVDIDGTIDISCTTRVEDGMDVVTDSEEVADERRGILEFLLINHPLDCPVCDKGGECPLQDYTMGYGPSESRYHGNKRTFPKFDLGELLTQRQNRCILCYRCTRFYQEEGGREDFRVIDRGNDAFVGKQPGGQLESELSGNMVDICPTGTIVTKPYLHKSRPWEQEPVESISGMDPLQTPITADVRGDEITRIRPQEEPDYPKPWIDDRVRFVHEYNSEEEERVELPNDEQYFDRFDDLKASLESYDSDEVAGIISPDRTLEELYQFRDYFRSNLGSDSVTTLPEVGSTKVNPTDLDSILESDFILVAGTNFREEYPMLTPFLRTADRNGASLAYLSYWGDNLTIEPEIYMKESPDELLNRIERLGQDETEDPTDEAIVARLNEAENPVVISCEGRTLGSELTNQLLQWNDTCDYLRLTPGANSKAAELLFDEPPVVRELLEKARDGELKALFTYGLDLLQEFPDRSLVKDALEELDYLGVADYLDNSISENADRVLPLTTQFEESGLLINAEGRIRQRPAVTDHGERILPGWEALSFLRQDDDNAYPDPANILDEIKSELTVFPDDLQRSEAETSSQWIETFDHEVPDDGPDAELNHDGDWVVFSEPRLFSGDRRARRCPSVDGMIQPSHIECNERDAETLGADRSTEVTLSLNGSSLSREIEITNEAPEGSLLIPWNGPEDESLDLYRSNRTLGRADVSAEPEGEPVQ
jgi:NADH-quinone oxidoreductase subunit G